MSVGDAGLVASLLDLVCEAAAQTAATDEPPLDETGLASVLGVPVEAIDRMCQAGHIPFVRRFHLDEVVAAIRARGTDEPGPRAPAQMATPAIKRRGAEQ